MALKIRLARHGAKKRPHYSVVVADARSPRDGKYIEKVGRANPMVEADHPDRLVLDAERITYWLSQGAQPTDRVERFLSIKGISSPYQLRAQTKKMNPKAKAQERLKAEEDAKAKREVDEQAAREAAAQAAAQPAVEQAPAEDTETVDAPVAAE